MDQATHLAPHLVRRTSHPTASPPDALDLAVMQTVADFRHGRRRGAAALAPLLRMNPGTLANKVSPAFTGQQLTLREALSVMQATQNYAILQSLCLLVEHVAHPLPDFSRCSDAALLDLWSQCQARLGAHAGTVHGALADGVITRAEMREVRNTLQYAMAAGLEFIARMEGLIREH